MFSFDVLLLFFLSNVPVSNRGACWLLSYSAFSSTLGMGGFLVLITLANAGTYCATVVSPAAKATEKVLVC